MKLGGALIFVILILSLIAPLITKQNSLNFELSERLEGPSIHHILGTDENGSDVLTKILYGGRLSLLISFTVVGISTLLGLILGTFAGYNTSFAQPLIMRTVDVLQSFPGFLIALALIAFMGSSVSNVILALCFTGWTPYARLVKAEVEKLKSKEFVYAAKAVGVSNLQIIVKHLWPNVVAVLAVQMSFGLAGAVVSEAGLSFLGLGVPPNIPSWGTLLSSGRNYLISTPELSLFPGLAILFLVLGFNLVGDGLRHYFDPKSQIISGP